jgi:hypothetical protein
MSDGQKSKTSLTFPGKGAAEGTEGRGRGRVEDEEEESGEGEEKDELGRSTNFFQQNDKRQQYTQLIASRNFIAGPQRVGLYIRRA